MSKGEEEEIDLTTPLYFDSDEEEQDTSSGLVEVSEKMAKLLIVRQICVNFCNDCGFIRTSMKLGGVIEHDP